MTPEERAEQAICKWNGEYRFELIPFVTQTIRDTYEDAALIADNHGEWEGYTESEKSIGMAIAAAIRERGKANG